MKTCILSVLIWLLFTSYIMELRYFSASACANTKLRTTTAVLPPWRNVSSAVDEAMRSDESENVSDVSFTRTPFLSLGLPGGSEIRAEHPDWVNWGRDWGASGISQCWADQHQHWAEPLFLIATLRTVGHWPGLLIVKPRLVWKGAGDCCIAIAMSSRNNKRRLNQTYHHQSLIKMQTHWNWI